MKYFHFCCFIYFHFLVANTNAFPCIESKSNSLFKQEVINNMEKNIDFQICDSILFVEKLLNVFRNDNNMCNFAFITKPFVGLNTHGMHYDGSRLRRTDFGIIAYIHFQILKKGTLNINKDFFIKNKRGKIEYGIYVMSPKYKHESKSENNSNVFLNGLYSKMLKWIKKAKKSKTTICNAAKESSYPLNDDYKWVN